MFDNRDSVFYAKTGLTLYQKKGRREQNAIIVKNDEAYSQTQTADNLLKA